MSVQSTPTVGQTWVHDPRLPKVPQRIANITSVTDTSVTYTDQNQNSITLDIEKFQTAFSAPKS